MRRRHFISALCALAMLVRGSIYVSAEELARDVELAAVDEMFAGAEPNFQPYLPGRLGEYPPLGKVAWRH